MVLAWQARLRQRPSFLTKNNRMIQEHAYCMGNSSFPLETAHRLLLKSKAKGTLRNYGRMIAKLEKFAEDKKFNLDPVSVECAGAFVCHLADIKTSYAEVCKVSPALTVLHSCQGHKTMPSVKQAYIKLLIEGAKREAAARRRKTLKADSISKTQMCMIVENILFAEKPNPIEVRTAMRWYVMYRTWCRWDGYAELKSENVTIDNEAVTMYFVRAKNDQYYSGTTCTLQIMGDENILCPRRVLLRYYSVLGYSGKGDEYLNCRIAWRKGKLIPKFKEKLGYTTSLENTKTLMNKFHITGRFSEKSLKVSGVSEAFNQGITVEDAMFHGRWRNPKTPGIYCNSSKKKRMKMSLFTM